MDTQILSNCVAGETAEVLSAVCGLESLFDTSTYAFLLAIAESPPAVWQSPDAVDSFSVMNLLFFRSARPRMVSFVSAGEVGDGKIDKSRSVDILEIHAFLTLVP